MKKQSFTLVQGEIGKHYLSTVRLGTQVSHIFRIVMNNYWLGQKRVLIAVSLMVSLLK